MTQEYFYDPNKPPSWTFDVEFDCSNLSPEDTRLAYEIIYAKEVVGLKGYYELLDRLARAGFRGEIVNRMQLLLPTLVVLNSKIEKN